jgi:hypothetical protein
MALPSRISLRFGAIALAVTLGACGNMQTSGGGGPAAEAPKYLVGDRWVYSAQDGFFRTVAHWEETHEVVAVGPDGITVRVTAKGPTISGERTEQWTAPGMVRVGSLVDNETRRFSTPLMRYDFPLVPGKVWNQRVNQVDEATGKEGEINRHVRVGGWANVTTPAGTFNAIGMRVSMWLDDETFWRFPTSCSYLVQYAPAVRNMVRAEKECEYREKGLGNAGIPIRSQHAVLELVSFTPGKP